MAKKDPPSECPMDGLLRLISGPWTTYILWRLSQDGPVRFGVLRRTIKGISPRVLTERLRRLEEAGLVLRHFKPTIPPEVSYELSPRVLELREVLEELSRIAERWDLISPHYVPEAPRRTLAGGDGPGY